MQHFFLLSDHSAMINGIILPIEGGLYSGSGFTNAHDVHFVRVVLLFHLSVP